MWKVLLTVSFWSFCTLMGAALAQEPVAPEVERDTSQDAGLWDWEVAQYENTVLLRNIKQLERRIVILEDRVTEIESFTSRVRELERRHLIFRPTVGPDETTPLKPRTP